ncbi:hypothetical protein PYW08_012712 [Mythimna loreyi]|uniref:Uncharacterized protein n=1 Tax=Mythimna loreyi TaxID=667449 RepID=A0ACC2Q2T5_9NEOP|nr:hypothetical protein PYW08_012712 [Mythimna loreyi]
MSYGIACRCCLLRAPDKDLKTEYSILGKSEVYADMLKECFEIQMSLNANEIDGGICEICITRLRDACDFKEQVLQCQKEFITKFNEFSVKDETSPKVKQEYLDLDEDNGIYFLELKDEISDDFDDFKDEDDNKKLAEMFGFNDVTIKKRSDKRRSKKRLLLDNTGKGTDLKSKRSAMKLSLRALTQQEVMMNKILKPVKISGDGKRLISDASKNRVNVDTLIKYSNCTPFANKTIAGILCAYCKTTYRDLPHLRTHILAEHSKDNLIENKRMDKNNLSIKMDITDLRCNLCNSHADTITNLKKHLTMEHDIKFYPDVYDYVMEFKLTDGETLNCALCNSKFETFKMLLQHMNGHYRNYICEICDLGFINQHKLRNHQRTHEIGNFNCSFCEKVFSTRVRKLCHEKYTHNPSARYTTTCPHCDESFTSYYRRNRHMAVEHNIAAATYKCNICDKSFILKSKLTSHIKKVHLMERNHICPECGQGFFIKQSLDEHMIKHNGERVFKCNVCSKAYARKKTLREHMRIHNNDRRFKCGVCSLAFVQKCSLKSHMLSNHGITLAEYENA